MAGRPWTPAERRRLKKAVGHMTYEQIAEQLDRTIVACRQEAFKLGLAAPRYSDEWRRKVSAANKGRRCSPDSEFKKGNIPWNRGKKFPLGIHPNCRKTQFKKGGIPGNLRAIGSVTVRRDKTGRQRRWIKVRVAGHPWGRFIPLACYLWENNHGPLPEGCFIVHANGKTMDDGYHNYKLMDRKRLLAWQRSVRPGMEAKRRKNCSRAARKRWADHRALKEFRERHRAAG